MGAPDLSRVSMLAERQALAAKLPERAAMIAAHQAQLDALAAQIEPMVEARDQAYEAATAAYDAATAPFEAQEAALNSGFTAALKALDDAIGLGSGHDWRTSYGRTSQVQCCELTGLPLRDDDEVLYSEETDRSVLAAAVLPPLPSEAADAA